MRFLIYVEFYNLLNNFSVYNAMSHRLLCNCSLIKMHTCMLPFVTFGFHQSFNGHDFRGSNRLTTARTCHVCNPDRVVKPWDQIPLWLAAQDLCANGTRIRNAEPLSPPSYFEFSPPRPASEACVSLPWRVPGGRYNMRVSPPERYKRNGRKKCFHLKKLNSVTGNYLK